MNDKSVINKFYKFVNNLGFFEEYFNLNEKMIKSGNISYRATFKLFDISITDTHKEDIEIADDIEYFIIREFRTFFDTDYDYYVYQNGEFREALCNNECNEHMYIHINKLIGESAIAKTISITNSPWCNPIAELNINDWLENQEKTEKMFRKINELKNVPEDTFEGWLSVKLQNKVGKKIGAGIEGSVYDFGENNKRVIKITTTDVISLYKSLNKDIKGMVKIYHIGLIESPNRFKTKDRYKVKLKGKKKVLGFSDFFSQLSQEIMLTDNKIGYIIMEKVETELVYKEMSYLINTLENTIFHKRNHKIFLSDEKLFNISSNTDALSYLYKAVMEDYDRLKNYLKKWDNLPPILFEMLEVFNSVSKIYPGWEDIHNQQFGRNRKGELVVFDIGDDDEKWGADLSKFPVPKNIIRENTNKDWLKNNTDTENMVKKINK
tara:strand:- start:60851 stop:62158 length:1308 start_codon:yes stop_codon:yes gene_type:complete